MFEYEENAAGDGIFFQRRQSKCGECNECDKLAVRFDELKEQVRCRIVVPDGFRGVIGDIIERR